MVTKALILQLCFALDLQLDGMVMEIRGCKLRRRGILDVGNLLEEWIRLELFRDWDPCPKRGNTPVLSKVSMTES